jgi:serine/threonine-protein kinase HipA
MSLDVYLYGSRIGSLRRLEGTDYEFAYDPGLSEATDPGGALLSNSLPLRDEPFSPETSRAYFDGLLPSGDRRVRVASELGLDPADGFALLAELGSDCPGGVAVLPEDEPMWAAEPAGALLSEAELAELLAPAPSRLFDPALRQRMRFAVPGERHKLALAEDEDEHGWLWPEPGYPSTHIVKPESDEHPESVANEMFCASVLRRAGLWMASAEPRTIAGRSCLVSQRFDRAIADGDKIDLFHQETFPQALGFAPDAPPGSAEAEGPGFAEASGMLRAFREDESVTVLVALEVCNYLLGNGDAHPSNLALLFSDEGPLQAPFYDVSSTVVYADPLHRGLTITDEYGEEADAEHLARLADQCQLGFDHCCRVAGNITVRLSEALGPVAEEARGAGWHAPVVDGIVELASERALGLAKELDR